MSEQIWRVHGNLRDPDNRRCTVFVEATDHETAVKAALAKEPQLDPARIRIAYRIDPATGMMWNSQHSATVGEPRK